VTITLNRPEIYNAFHRDMILELNDALRRDRNDSDVYAVIVTGADDGFCAGADVDSMPSWSDQSKTEYGAYLWTVQNVVRQLRTVRKPTSQPSTDPQSVPAVTSHSLVTSGTSGRTRSSAKGSFALGSFSETVAAGYSRG